MQELVFITGSTGLVGGHILVQLIQKGYRVRALKRQSSSFKQLRTICSYYKLPFRVLQDKVEWVLGDTLDYVGMKQHLSVCTTVYHCAAVVSFNNQNQEELLRTNIRGTANMVDAALEAGIKQFCYISSIGALGSQTDQEINEATDRDTSVMHSAYSESKYHSELEVWRASAEGLPVCILNPGVILGPGLPDKGSMLIFQAGQKGIPFYTTGVTGYVDVRDVAKAAILLMEKKQFGERYILVSENLDTKTLFGMIAKAFDKNPPRFKAGPFLLNFVGFLSEIYGKLSNTNPQMTRETARTATKIQRYSSEKIRSFHPEIQFIPIAETVTDTADFIKKI